MGKAEHPVRNAKPNLTGGRGGDIIVECTGVAEAIPEGLEMARSGGAYFVAGVFADVGDIPINPHRHLLANQIRLFGMTNHPPTGYPSSLRLLNKFKTAYPLKNSSPTNSRSIRWTRRWPKPSISTPA
jgi:threonine dehydrogenase-like Zn-dependent dehydrogenase